MSAEGDGERLPIVIAGAAGRMGQALIRIAGSSGCKVVGAIEHGASSSVGRDAGEIAGASEHEAPREDADAGNAPETTA